jgi:hypothetical protein
MAIWGATQWLRLTKEAVFATFDVAATVVHWIRLIEGASFGLEATIYPWTIRGADGGNLRQQRGNQRLAYIGRLRTPLYPTQAVNLIPWLCTPTTVGGRKQLDSYSADLWDGNEIRRWVGLRPTGGNITSDNGRDYLMLELDLQAKMPGTPPGTFAEPASTVFPAEHPYVHQDSSGLITLGSAVTNYKSLSVTIRNMIAANFNESQYVTGIDYCGRDVSAQIVAENNATTNRIRYEGSAAVAASVGFNVASPAHSFTLNMQGNCFVGARTVDRDFGNNQYETLTIESYKDGTSGSDLAASAT